MSGEWDLFNSSITRSTSPAEAAILKANFSSWRKAKLITASPLLMPDAGVLLQDACAGGSDALTYPVCTTQPWMHSVS